VRTRRGTPGLNQQQQQQQTIHAKFHAITQHKPFQSSCTVHTSLLYLHGLFYRSRLYQHEHENILAAQQTYLYLPAMRTGAELSAKITIREPPMSIKLSTAELAAAYNQQAAATAATAATVATADDDKTMTQRICGSSTNGNCRGTDSDGSREDISSSRQW
jgi:hypothetical protein